MIAKYNDIKKRPSFSIKAKHVFVVLKSMSDAKKIIKDQKNKSCKLCLIKKKDLDDFKHKQLRGDIYP